MEKLPRQQYIKEFCEQAVRPGARAGPDDPRGGLTAVDVRRDVFELVFKTRHG